MTAANHRHERYADILDRCLEREDKTHRDAVLAEYPIGVQRMVRGQMLGVAKRLATWIRHAGARDRDMTPELVEQLQRERFAAIQPEWLRERVRRIHDEQLEYVARHQREMRQIVGSGRR